MGGERTEESKNFVFRVSILVESQNELHRRNLREILRRLVVINLKKNRNLERKSGKIGKFHSSGA